MGNNQIPSEGSGVQTSALTLISFTQGVKIALQIIVNIKSIIQVTYKFIVTEIWAPLAEVIKLRCPALILVIFINFIFKLRSPHHGNNQISLRAGICLERPFLGHKVGELHSAGLIFF